MSDETFLATTPATRVEIRLMYGRRHWWRRRHAQLVTLVDGVPIYRGTWAAVQVAQPTGGYLIVERLPEA